MSQIILPKLAPSPAATETKANASEEMLAGTSAAQPFEEFLDAQHGSLASQPQESELPPTQTAAQANKKKDTKAPVTDQSPATASVKTLVPAPTSAPSLDKKNARAAAPNQQGTPAPEQTNGLPATALEAVSMQAAAIANPPAAPSPVLTKSENGAAPPSMPLPKAATMAAPAALSQPAAAAAALSTASSAPAAKSTQGTAKPPASPSPAVSTIPAAPAVMPAAPLPAPAATQRGAAVVYAATPATQKTPSPIISVRAAAPPAPSGDRQFTVTIKAASSAAPPGSPPPVTSTPTALSQAPSDYALPVATSQATAVAKPAIAPAPASLVPTPTVANSQAPVVVALQIPISQAPGASPPIAAPQMLATATAPIATGQSPAAAVAPIAISHSQTLAAPAATTGTAPTAMPLKTEPGQSAQALITAQPQPAAAPNIQAPPNASLPAAPAESTEAAVAAAVSTSVTVRASGPAPARVVKRATAAEIADPLGTAGKKGGGETVSSPSTPEETPSTEELAPIGTAIAKQDHAMSQTAQFLETETDFRTNGPGVVDAAPAPRTQAPAVAKTIAAPQGSTSQQPSTPAAQAPAFSISNAAILAEKTSPGTSTASTSSQNLASTALNNVMEAADKMTSDGTSHVEVQVNLGDGQQLSVRLQMTQGTVHTVFKTTSPELRQAIEQNWSGFRTGATERGLQISTAVFESPGSEGSFNTFGNRNQSGQPDAEFQDADGGQPSMPKGSQETATPIISSPPAPSPAGSSVQMYA
jgi:hypothetical protein